MGHYKLSSLGIVISDSRTYPLRKGVTGVALGYAGIRGVNDYTGTDDLFGRTFKFESTNVVDCLATAAVLGMGEGSESQPLALITECASVVFTDETDESETKIAPEDDMYLPFTKND
jgi:dihydrofolate synthase / folylpolyglutamate synthase